MLNTMTEDENKYHDLRPRSQRKNGNISKTFAFFFITVFNMMKLLVKILIIKIFARINVFKKV